MGETGFGATCLGYEATGSGSKDSSSGSGATGPGSFKIDGRGMLG